MNTPTSEVINLAADLIEERGWTKGGVGMLADNTSKLCLEGAIGAVIDAGTVASCAIEGGPLVYDYDHIHACPAYAAVQDYLGGGQTLWVWNDMVADVQRVIEVLRAAAAVEAAREDAALLAEMGRA